MDYAFDLWVHQWRKRYARGRVIILRYCDDFVMGFQYAADARRMLAELKEGLAKFKLALHDKKPRLIEFGNLASKMREERGAGRCETLNFLGFTHFCARSLDGRFVVKRRTDRRRLVRKLKELRAGARRRMHVPVGVQRDWLASVLRGHHAYYGLPSNWPRLDTFYDEVCRLWYRVSSRCSQRWLAWSRFEQMLERFPLPRAHITHSRTVVAC
jgi:RNA-directed DNA polymerase